jgi:hypothetical protein
VCHGKNVAFKEQVCIREDNLLKKIYIFLQTWYLMALPMWVHVSMVTFTTINLQLNFKGASCISSWEDPTSLPQVCERTKPFMFPYVIKAMS